MRRYLSIPLLLVSFLLVSCAPEVRNGFTVATWNMYAFFDGRSDGTEYDEFRSSSGYTQAKYEERVKNTALFMHRYLGEADVLILEEVESEEVLHDLVSSGLDRYGYLWYGLAQREEGMLSVGFISKLPPLEIRVHGTEDSRLILELVLDVGGRLVDLFGIHAKSRVGSGTEEMRKEEFSLLSRLMDEASGSLVIALGDFNCDPFSNDPGMATERGSRHSDAPLVLTGDGGATGRGVYFSPVLDYMKPLDGGSYWYDGEWSFLDNILIGEEGFDGFGLEYRWTRVIAPAEASDYMGRPRRYEASTGKGYSDHFALMTYFSYN